MAVWADAERDFARGGVNLHIRMASQRSYETAVIENITWRTVQQGEEAPSTPFFLDERFARHLAEQLNDFNPATRRAREQEQMYSDARNELRSVANQLEEVRNHNNTLQNTNDELHRHVRWLERELRDANRERREAV
jgi:septation ring formation regulator EzrA